MQAASESLTEIANASDRARTRANFHRYVSFHFIVDQSMTAYTRNNRALMISNSYVARQNKVVPNDRMISINAEIRSLKKFSKILLRIHKPVITQRTVTMETDAGALVHPGMNLNEMMNTLRTRKVPDENRLVVLIKVLFVWY